MKSIVVVGAQWGDEGKGKVVDYLAASFDYIARCAGGHNAGHTVIFNGSRFVLQLIPCGILRPGKHAVIGSGVVVDPAALVIELDTLAKAGIDVTGRLHLSNRAHLIFPYHRQMEKAAEAARGAAKIGTTSRGIGPAYEDKMARRGIRVGELLDPARFREKLSRVDRRKGRGVPRDTMACRSIQRVWPKSLSRWRIASGPLHRRYFGTPKRMRSMPGARSCLKARKARCWPHRFRHLSLRHILRTRFPAARARASASVPSRINAVVGVTKAYTTRVGSGPFPTEMPDLEATEVRDRGKEYGAVTGRPRRCGWLDLAVLRYAIRINGISSLVVTKLDVFDTQKGNSSLHRLPLQGLADQGDARVGGRSGRSYARISHAAQMAVRYIRRPSRWRETSARGRRLPEIYFRFPRRRKSASPFPPARTATPRSFAQAPQLASWI